MVTNPLLIFHISRREAIRDLGQAVDIAKELLGVVQRLGIEPGWRVQETDPFRSVEELADMVIEFDAGQPGRHPFVWSIVCGVGPRYLNVSLTVGLDGRQVHGSFWLKASDDDASFSAMSGVFDDVARLHFGRVDQVLEHLVLSPGPWFAGEVDEGAGEDQRRIAVGWRNLVRADPTTLDESLLPAWCVLQRHEEHLELTLGPDPRTLLPSQARDMRKRLVNAGVLPVPDTSDGARRTTSGP